MFMVQSIIDLNFARSTAAEELAAQDAMGICWEPYRRTLERKCAIIDAMTAEERREFVHGIRQQRIEEIASDAGVPRADVVALLNGYTQLADSVAAELLCETTHRTMIAGRCPWCGGDTYETGETQYFTVEMLPAVSAN